MRGQVAMLPGCHAPTTMIKLKYLKAMHEAKYVVRYVMNVE
jgi:hypothetical protein